MNQIHKHCPVPVPPLSGWYGPHHLLAPGPSHRVPGPAQPVPPPDGGAAGATAASGRPGALVAPRRTDPGGPGAQHHHPGPGDHLLVLRPAAAPGHAPEPHRHGDDHYITVLNYTIL